MNLSDKELSILKIPRTKFRVKTRFELGVQYSICWTAVFEISGKISNSGYLLSLTTGYVEVNQEKPPNIGNPAFGNQNNNKDIDTLLSEFYRSIQSILERYNIRTLVQQSNCYAEEKSVEEILQYVIGVGTEDLLMPDPDFNLQQKFIAVMKRQFTLNHNDFKQ